MNCQVPSLWGNLAGLGSIIAIQSSKAFQPPPSASMSVRPASSASIHLVHADLRALLALSLGSREEPPPLGNEQPSLCVERRRVTRDPVVMTLVPVLEHFKKACPGEHLNTAFARAIEDIVRRGLGFTGRNYLSDLRVN